VIADGLELAVFVLQFEVVPILATDKHTGVAVLQLKVMDALEDLRERLALLEVQRPSSPVEDWPVPPLTKPTSELSASRMPQLAPTDSDESNVPSISPMLNEMACAWAQQPKAPQRPAPAA
jgi:hypothetical protein